MILFQHLNAVKQWRCEASWRADTLAVTQPNRRLFSRLNSLFFPRVELGRLERQPGWAEPRLKPPFSGIHVHFRQCSLCLSGLRTVTLKSYEGELNADGCGDFNEYKLAEYC